jgi:hypothetical protein
MLNGLEKRFVDRPSFDVIRNRKTTPYRISKPQTESDDICLNGKQM